MLWLLPLLAVVAVILATSNRPRFEKSFLQQVEEDGVRAQNRKADRVAEADVPVRKRTGTPVQLSNFDPNTLDVSGFETLGFSRRQAEVIVKYRTARGGFGSADDLAKCYVVSDEMMERLRPYINIVDNRAPDSPYSQPEADGTDGGSGRSPAGRDSGRSAMRGKVELNTADSTTLRSVSGIGNMLVVRILDYRERLGGFVSAEQLREIPGMYDENFQRIITQIFVDTCEIQKIDINFASPEALGKHPYIDAGGLRKILKHRQLKGGWRTTDELVNENILTPEQAARLAPYLTFN